MPCALILTADEEVVGFAEDLRDLGYSLVASTEVVELLRVYRIAVQNVSELAMIVPALLPKVPLLSAEVQACILASEKSAADRYALKERNLPRIDLLCASLPDRGEVYGTPAQDDDIASLILMHLALVNERVVVTRKGDRDRVLAWLRDGRPNNDQMLAYLAAVAYQAIMRYDLSRYGHVMERRATVLS